MKDEIKEELAKISFSNIGHCVNTNLILDYITTLQEENEKLKKQILAQNKVYSDLEDKYITLKSIIKEIRKYIEKTQIYSTSGLMPLSGSSVGEIILKILDKENKQ